MFLAMKSSKRAVIVVACLVVLGLGIPYSLVVAPHPALAQGQQGVPASMATGFHTIREDTVHADLTFLASDALQGRMSLQTGDEAAIQWIASEFAKAGLQPAASGSFLRSEERRVGKGVE